MNIYVGNLSRNLTEEQLKDLFAEFGEVVKATIIMDKFTGVARGFGFVEMSSQEEGEAAIAELNGKEVDGRTLTVNPAKPRTERPRTGGGGFGGNRGGSRGGYGSSNGGGRDSRSGGFGGNRGGSRY